ncbi:polyprenol monophosphomannose synthase [Microbacterium excoecariae]|uniref:polyprenol monophosphomannose synthase n=1 Tax=Microbacterium excoecariae TaxID=2715210 RepID=UPI00140E5798|nr:polyprenol monophosphomannose synthase [Microbacterium excoecariae]NHI16079.1 polyprenol monophosphomannose synthase [Microbacterium excoecariae]
MRTTLTIIPTFNEIENITGVVDRVLATGRSDVLIVDDSSPDGTGELADELAARHESVFALHRRTKDGLGPAYLAGFAWGRSRGYDVLVEMDADGSHQPEALPTMLDELASADIVLGSRWVPGGSVVNWPLHRKVLSRGGNIYARLALGIDVRDATGGYRAYRTSALDAIGLDGIASQGYCFQLDMLWRGLERGLRVVEVPITFIEREHGVSKMSGNIVRESLVNVSAWGLRRRITALRELVLHHRRLPSVRANTRRLAPS